MVAKKIMFQGTGSDVGKSVLTAGIARILAQEGFKTAPFKAQNMALNSYITSDGKEISRAQAVQAKAAKVEATADMNPVLLKPSEDDKAQVIIQGSPRANMTAKEYFFNPEVGLEEIKDSLKQLDRDFEALVLEGAGSPAEVNLRDYDRVNMKAARLAKAPVILVADIDRGGVFASLVGTMELLTSKERSFVAGIVINKFRGEKERLQPGLDYLEWELEIPVLGVIPYVDEFNLPEEDAISAFIQGAKDYELDIGIIKLPRISNFTDFTPLSWEPKTRLRYIEPGESLENLDAVIIPGSKNVIADLEYLYQTGTADEIATRIKEGVTVIGICGGYQMLGETIADLHGVEGVKRETEGLGFLDLETVLADSKVTHQVEARAVANACGFDLGQERIKGYEIHQGKSRLGSQANPLFKVVSRSKKPVEVIAGAYSSEYNVWGTYLHGLFNNDWLRRQFINHLRRKKDLESLAGGEFSAQKKREEAYNKWASLLRRHLDLKQLGDIMGVKL